MAEYKGIEFAGWSVHWMRDPKVVMLKNATGRLGCALYQDIVTLAKKEHGYWIEDNDITVAVIADDAKVDEKLVRDVVKKCLEIGLFDRKQAVDNNDEPVDNFIITCKRMWDDYAEVCKRAHRKVIDYRYFYPSHAIESTEKYIPGQACAIKSPEKTHAVVVAVEVAEKKQSVSKTTITEIGGLVENFLGRAAFEKGRGSPEADRDLVVDSLLRAASPDRVIRLPLLAAYLDDLASREPGPFGGRPRNLRVLIKPGGWFDKDREQFSHYDPAGDV